MLSWRLSRNCNFTSASPAMPSGRCRPSGSGMNRSLTGSARYVPRWTPLCRSRRLALQPRRVVLPRHAVHARCGTAPERQERISKRIDGDVAQQRGERLPLPLPCGLWFAFQPRGHATAALSPSRVWLVRVALGLRPWPLPQRAHESGLAWFAVPSLQGICTLCSLPVSRRSRPKSDPGVQRALPESFKTVRKYLRMGKAEALNDFGRGVWGSAIPPSWRPGAGLGTG